MFKGKFIASLLIVLSVVFLFSLNSSLAVETVGTENGGYTGADGVSLSNPLGPNTTPNSIIGRVINAVLGIIGSLALLMFVYGGITWMTSSGSPEKIKKGRDIIIWSVIGLAIIFFSYALVNFVIFDIIGG